MSIRLARIETFLYRAEVSEPVKTSFGSIPRRSALLLRVEDTDGAHGWGEIWCNFPPYSADNKVRLMETVVAPAALGKDFHDPSDAWQTLTARTRRWAIQGAEQGPIGACIAGLDLALWDMTARRAGVSKQTIYNQFGGKEDLFRSLVEQRRHSLTAALEQPGAEERLEETLTAYARSLLDKTQTPATCDMMRIGVAAAMEHPELARILYEAGVEAARDRLAMFLRVERLSAEVEDRELRIPDDVRAKVPGQAGSEEALFQSRQQQLKDEVAGLEQQLVQKQQELREFASKQAQYRNSLELLRQEIAMSAPLVGQGAMSQVELLRLKRAEVENRGQLDATSLAIPRAEAAIKEVERKVAETRSRFRSDALKELNEARTDLSKAEATGKALEDRVNRTLVTSPVRGIVKQLLVNTIGGVIQPGSDLVEIVPLDDTLLVEARIRPQDIAFLHPGQKAMVKFTAYDYTIYGGLPAELEQIGADTVTDEDGNSFYLIKLRTRKSHLGSDEKPLLIIPGMVASNRRMFLWLMAEGRRHQRAGCHVSVFLHASDAAGAWPQTVRLVAFAPN